MSISGPITFDGRVAIVTGAGGSLGRAYALELARRGARVVVNDVRGAAAVVEEIRARGGDALASPHSVSTQAGGQAIVEEALGAFGAVDVLINNAGIVRDRSLANLSAAELEAVLDVHLRGRYTGSFETQITQDAQSFTGAADGQAYLARLRKEIETSLTPDFWEIRLPQALATSAAGGPGLFAYAASLCLLNARVPPFVEQDGAGEQKAGLFLRDLFDPVVTPKKAPVERHHLFPRNYLEKIGITGIRNYNQIANFSYVEWPENIAISDKPPSDYWPRFAKQFTAADRKHHALPDGWDSMSYEDFLVARRKLMAAVIRRGFEAIGAAPQEQPEEAPPLVPATIADTYLHPDRPFSNDVAIRKLIRQLRGSVFWYEQHMDRKALELLNDELDLGEIDQVKLLSGPANLSSKTKRAFERFATELERHGVPVDWRVVPADRARTMHARVMRDDGNIFELPPLNSVLAGTVDSIRTSEMPMEAFERAWSEDGVPLGEFPTDT